MHRQLAAYDSAPVDANDRVAAQLVLVGQRRDRDEAAVVERGQPALQMQQLGDAAHVDDRRFVPVTLENRGQLASAPSSFVLAEIPIRKRSPASQTSPPSTVPGSSIVAERRVRSDERLANGVDLPRRLAAPGRVMIAPRPVRIAVSSTKVASGCTRVGRETRQLQAAARQPSQ